MYVLSSRVWLVKRDKFEDIPGGLVVGSLESKMDLQIIYTILISIV